MILADFSRFGFPANGKFGIGDPKPPETDANFIIGDPMTSVSNPNLHIEPVSSSASIGHRISQGLSHNINIS
jgi:hypothetical protein